MKRSYMSISESNSKPHNWITGTEYSHTGANSLSMYDMLETQGRGTYLPQCGAKSSSYGYMTTKRRVIFIDNHAIFL